MAPNKQRHRPALIALVVVAAATCLGLAWWQWNQFESSGGTGQNLGYALQWPAFAAFCVYAYRKFVVLESDPEEVQKLNSRGVTEIPEGILPSRPDAAPTPLVEDGTTDGAQIAEYNRLLAELADADNHRAAESRSTRDHPTDKPQRSNQ